MATVIRSPPVGEPRRIATCIHAEVKSSDVASANNKRFATEKEVASSQQFEANADAASAMEKGALDTALEDLKNGFAAELQSTAARADSAEQRLRNIESELTTLRDNAARAGREEGIQKGLEEGRLVREELARSMKGVIASLEAQRVHLLEEKEDRLVEIVYAAVIRILGETLVGETGVRNVVLQVLRHVSRRDPMLVRVAPHDHAVIATLSQELGEAGTPVEVVSDECVDVGGCIVETTGGSLDGRLEVQLQNFKSALLSARTRRRAETEGIDA